MALSKLLTDEDLSELTGLAITTWPARRQRGACPRFIKLGRGRSALIRYRVQDVEAWLESQVRSSTSDPGEDPDDPRGAR